MSVSGSGKLAVKSPGSNLSDSGSTRSTRFRFLSWSPETYTLPEFVKSFTLPRVVRVTNCEDAALVKSLVLPADVDITQPILLYKRYRAVKVTAKCLKASKSGKLKEVGCTIVIPDSYPGWFSLLTQDGKECAMMLTSMGQVAAARVPAFLTKFDVPVYKLTDSNEPGGKSVYVRTTMKAGSVLRLLGVWADLNGASRNYSSSSSYSSHHHHHHHPHNQHHHHHNLPPNRQSSKGAQFLGGSLGGFGGRLVARSLSHSPQQQASSQVQYVQCLSHENEPIFIPFWATGIFYPIAPRGGRNPQHIYPLSAIARAHKLPIRVKMVFGCLPNNVPDFTGNLEIENVETEEVILACTLLKDKPSLFEMDMHGEVLLSAMTSEDLFTKSTGYQTALSFCQSEAESWKRQIRICQWKSGGGTVSSTSLLKKNKTLRIRSSPPPPSKLSLLFGPSGGPFGSGKDPLRRSKSFNVEIQSVSLSLTQDEEEEETKKLSTLFGFMHRGQNNNNNNGKKSTREKQLAQLQHPDTTVPDVLPVFTTTSHSADPSVAHQHNHHHHHHSRQQVTNHQHHNLHHHPHHHHPHHQFQGNNGLSSGNNSSSINSNSSSNNSKNSADLPYGKVLDDVTEEENIYSEISDALTMKLSLNPIHGMGMNFHRLPIPRHHSASNMSSLLKGGGGSDGAFSGTLSGTFSSSNPSNREEDIYDSVF